MQTGYYYICINKCPLRIFYPQIADSTLLTPVFVFDDDSLKKDSLSSDTNVLPAQPKQDTAALINNDTVQISPSLSNSPATPPHTHHSPTRQETLNLSLPPVSRDILVSDTAKADSLHTQKTSVPLKRVAAHYPSKRFDGIQQTHSSNAFFLIELLLVFLLVGVRVYRRRLFRKFLRAFLSLSVLHDLHNESKTYSTPVFWVGLLNYIVQAAFFADFYSHKTATVDWSNAFQLGSIIFIFNIAKYIVYRISGIIFDKNELFAKYGLYHFIALIVAGIGLFFVNILFFYTLPELFVLNIGLYLLAIPLIFKQIAFAFLSLHQKVSGFHIFLYLCTLEILPFIVAYNWFNL